MIEYVRAANQPMTVDIKLADGIFAKSTTFPRAGMVAPQHAHEYAHLSIIAAGAVEVEKDGKSLGYYEAPSVIHIEAKSKHLFRILQFGTTVICVHNVDRCEAGEIAIHEEHHLDFQDEP